MEKNSNKKVTLTKNTIVKLRNGMYGLIVAFNEKPVYIVLRNFIKHMTAYNEELKYKNNSTYDIVEIHDGSKLDNVADIFKSRFDIDQFELIAEING